MSHVNVDQGAVVHDLGLSGMNEAHAAHVRRQLVHFVEPTRCDGQGSLTVFRLTQIHLQEFVRLCGSELRLLDIHPAHPHALLFQSPDQMTPNKTTRSTHQGFFHKSISKNRISARSGGFSCRHFIFK